ncbi:MAG: hemin uptake protein HemP [Pseudomonadota bacterium]
MNSIRPTSAPNGAVAGSETETKHEALDLTQGAATARIVHLGQVYTLRITRQGKLILTK